MKWSIRPRQRQGIAQHGRHRRHHWCPPNLRFYLQSTFHQLFSRTHTPPMPMCPVAATVLGEKGALTGRGNMARHELHVSMCSQGRNSSSHHGMRTCLNPLACDMHPRSAYGHPCTVRESRHCTVRRSLPHSPQVAPESSFSSAHLPSESAHHLRRCDPCPQGGIR